jgi:hypothetical protein
MTLFETGAGLTWEQLAEYWENVDREWNKV